MVMLSAMLAASVPVDPITRIATLGRGLAAGRALLTGLVALSAEFVYQPEVGSKGLNLRFGNSVRSVLPPSLTKTKVANLKPLNVYPV
jgi:hypothetical protein